MIFYIKIKKTEKQIKIKKTEKQIKINQVKAICI